jgi:hypothetical protein
VAIGLMLTNGWSEENESHRISRERRGKNLVFSYLRAGLTSINLIQVILWMQVHKIMWFILGTWMLDNLELL